MPRTLEDYRRLPYQRAMEVEKEGDHLYFVYRLVEIPEVVGDGATKEQAQENLRRCFDDLIEWRLEDKLPIPEPTRAVLPAPHQEKLVDVPSCVETVAKRPHWSGPVESWSLADALNLALMRKDDLVACH